jgi:hypothetical protein
VLSYQLRACRRKLFASRDFWRYLVALRREGAGIEKREYGSGKIAFYYPNSLSYTGFGLGPISKTERQEGD